MRTASAGAARRREGRLTTASAAARRPPSLSTYTFTVKALDQDDNASTSNAVTLTTEASTDVTPPSVPTNVRIVGSNGCPEFFVGWTQSTDDTDPQHLIEYEIYVNGVLSPLAVSAGVDEDFVYATRARRRGGCSHCLRHPQLRLER